LPHETANVKAKTAAPLIEAMPVLHAKAAAAAAAGGGGGGGAAAAEFSCACNGLPFVVHDYDHAWWWSCNVCKRLLGGAVLVKLTTFLTVIWFLPGFKLQC
jgi:hypothetical protein